jgi:hypothetical protein
MSHSRAVSRAQNGCACVLFGNGDGTFRAGTRLFAPPLYLSSPIATADFNGDGIPDLLATGTNGSDTDSKLELYLGKGDGTFQAPILTDIGAAIGSVYVGDLNGDGTFTPLPPDSSVQTTSLVLGDFNGDGRLDIAFPTPNGAGVAIGNGDGTLGDFNGDGKLDGAVTGTAGVAILLANGDGTFKYPTFFGSNSFFYVTTADLDGDGTTDLITEFYGGGVGGNTVSAQVLLGNGDGTLKILTPFGVASGLFSGQSSSLAAADLTGDGKLDLISGDNSGHLEAFPGKGDGTFGSAVTFPLAASYVNPVVADFNLDGKPDVAVGTNSGWLPMYYNTTQPDFTISATALSPASVSPGGSATSTISIAPWGIRSKANAIPV